VYSRQRVVVTDVSGPLAVLSQGPAEGMRVVTDGAAELFGVEFGAGK
jgi:membrane fusion protein, heavy metal efflux system